MKQEATPGDRGFHPQKGISPRLKESGTRGTCCGGRNLEDKRPVTKGFPGLRCLEFKFRETGRLGLGQC